MAGILRYICHKGEKERLNKVKEGPNIKTRRTGALRLSHSLKVPQESSKDRVLASSRLIFHRLDLGNKPGCSSGVQKDSPSFKTSPTATDSAGSCDGDEGGERQEVQSVDIIISQNDLRMALKAKTRREKKYLESSKAWVGLRRTSKTCLHFDRRRSRNLALTSKLSRLSSTKYKTYVVTAEMKPNSTS